MADESFGMEVDTPNVEPVEHEAGDIEVVEGKMAPLHP